MTRCRLPIKRSDGSVIVEPLHPTPTHHRHVGVRPLEGRKVATVDDTRIQRAKILRDLAILALLAITIIAGSAVIIGTLWRDVAVAENQARMVEAEQAATVRLAEVERLAASDERPAEELLVMVFVGFGIAIIALVLARPSIIIGR